MDTSQSTHMPSSLKLRIYYEDTDAGGLVYHANYLRFYERARTELLSSLGFEQDVLLKNELAFVVKKVTVDNIRGLKFNARIDVKTTVSQVKKASMYFEQWIEEDNVIVNKGEFVIAAVNIKTMKPMRIPVAILEELSRVGRN